MASEGCMDKGMYKSQTTESPGSAKMQANKRIGKLWSLCVECPSGLKDSVSTSLVLLVLACCVILMLTEWECHRQHRLADLG